MPTGTMFVLGLNYAYIANTMPVLCLLRFFIITDFSAVFCSGSPKNFLKNITEFLENFL